MQTCKGNDSLFIGTDPGNSGSMQNVGLEMDIWQEQLMDCHESAYGTLTSYPDSYLLRGLYQGLWWRSDESWDAE